ncbi:MAG: phosphoribosylformylglycinamidine synthase I [Planctomycetota bacterium]|nr:phosphoribosylformylglycinamidine synthase I [Planctomycetota bacterium]
MATPRVLILRAPGTNCDGETAFAFHQSGAESDVVHINRLRENPALTRQYQVLCIPGGFSYGDDVAAGRILANQLRHHLADAIAEFKEAGKLVLGICNGFQVLIKSGMLLPADEAAVATLTWNDSRQFEDRWVDLAVVSSKSVFLRDIHSMYLPIAHAEGKFVVREERQLQRLESEEQLVLRYASQQGNWRAPLAFPENPNGSVANVAGICDDSGRILGLMPHPERHIDRTQHPRWTRGEGRDPGDGLQVFRNAVQFFAS